MTGGTATFKYDPFGRRIQKVFTQNSTTTTANYLYDGDNAIETVDQNGSVVAKFAQGQNIDEPFAESVGGATYDYEQDGLGSVSSLTGPRHSIPSVTNHSEREHHLIVARNFNLAFAFFGRNRPRFEKGGAPKKILFCAKPHIECLQ